MMDADRTAIHEVMEQQTVSIAKAGIMTTLNARVSILAAANPAFGRFNPHRALTDNLQLPPALLSRFDILWLILDKPSVDEDLNLASHVTHIHSHPNEQPQTDHNALDMKVMRKYIRLCKTVHPTVPKELTDKLVKIYVDIRKRWRESEKSDEVVFTSPRSLLAIIRMATAFARLRLAKVVEEADIDAAYSLYNSSRESLEGAHVSDTTNADIFELIKKMSSDSEMIELNYSDIIEVALQKGFKEHQVEKTLNRLKEFGTIDYDGHSVVLCG